ncbi:hypothetical protein [Citreimonas salinaria]|uniref:Uncharacterized protein n=1 Tax=Citreimonas salinaria TaxID=321339 RepID=A0A1H3FL17_9RHOB|nr:hypothetical protein [Citreimonas salinaria]SDX90809.1 hypothetical protein SAMN05444340_101465 [Citreimonas salinaria]
MWPHPIPEKVPADAALSDAIEELAGKLAVRRIEPEALAPDIAAFAETHGGDAATMGLVFEGVFDRLSRRRTRIIDGIAEFSTSQIGVAAQIEAARQDMVVEMEKDDPDFDKVDDLEEQIDWDQTIYSDRQQSITYLCETPTLLEKRIYAIAQLLQAEIDEGGSLPFQLGIGDGRVARVVGVEKLPVRPLAFGDVCDRVA